DSVGRFFLPDLTHLSQKHSSLEINSGKKVSSLPLLTQFGLRDYRIFGNSTGQDSHGFWRWSQFRFCCEPSTSRRS
ncbi:MAG TPA: hypothetical protein VHW45_07330, partial [Candidatus Sulfotelmatobacter sp.]|nr:hypothetical protein [Candidatus Sulfotelmatobacter sp.]